MEKKTAVVTGGTRGIGLEICRQLAKKGFHVLLTARDEKKGREAAEKIKKEGGEAVFAPLDVSSRESISRFKGFLDKEYPAGIDVLINNAAVMLGDEGENTPVLALKPEILEKTLETNLFGPLYLSQAAAQALVKKKGRIINLSSGLGQLSEMGGGWPAYRFSKTALNALSRMLAAELKDKVSVNSMCPGWVRTDMGGPNAVKSVEEGADTAVWLASEVKPEVTGRFFRERKEIAW